MSPRTKIITAVRDVVSLGIVTWLMVSSIRSGNATQAALTGMWLGLVIAVAISDVTTWRRRS